MSAVEHTNIPLTTAINPQEDPGNFINIEDLLYRTIRKTHQKTYRNRNRHHIAADTTLQKPASPHKELLNDDPAPSIDVATAENPSKAGGTVEESRKRKGRQKVGCKDDDMNSVKYRASQKRKRTRSAPEKMLTLVKNAERSEISRGVCLSGLKPSTILIARHRVEIIAASTSMISSRNPHDDQERHAALTKYETVSH